MTDKLKQFLNEHKPETISNLMRWTQYNDIKQEIMDLTSFLIGIPKFSERLYCLNNNLKAVPVCAVCDKCVKFKTYGEGYSETCSRECRYKHQPNKIKKTMQEKYGVEYALQSDVFLKKAQETCIKNFGVENIFNDVEYIKAQTKIKTGVENIFNDVEYIKKKFQKKYGVNHPSKVKKFINKSKQTCLIKYGCEFSFQSENNKKKTQCTKKQRYDDSHYNNQSKSLSTLFKNYGVSNPSHIPFISEKRKSTMVDRYGVEHIMQSDEYKEKYTDTMNERYGVSYPMQNSELFEKRKSTMVDRYGVEHIMQSDEYKEKYTDTMNERYGVPYAMQNPASHEKQQCRRWKDYTLPSGKIVKLQGYEDKALDILLKTYNENDLIMSRKDMPEFWYMVDDKPHRYYPDIYIPLENKIIEVKSSYTYNVDIQRNLLKAECVRFRGYIFEFMIL